MYTKEYDGILKTQSEIESKGFIVENNIIDSVDVNTIAHFGNINCLAIWCKNVAILSSHNNSGNLGYLIKALIEILDLEREDGIRLRDIKDIPVRIVLDKKFGRCIGFGCFMKDRFVLTEDFVKIGL